MINVSIIIPCFNEVNYIEKCLNSIFYSINQDDNFHYEVIVSDGGSTDGTIAILDRIKENNKITLLNNSKKKQVYALNQMLNYCSGDFIVRCDAHSLYPVGYFSGLVNYLINNPNVGNVGYGYETISEGDSNVEFLISKCLSSKFGVGSSHRTNKSLVPLECDTLLFGAWRKEVFEDYGLFDKNFIRGQDLEHNIRLTKGGLKVIQLSDNKFTYFGRTSISKLFRMMMQYSSVKPFIFKKHKIFPNVRSFIPLFFWLSIFTSMLVNIDITIFIGSFYLFTAFLFTIKEIGIKNPLNNFIMLFIFLVQHLGHAMGWFAGLSKILDKNIDWNATR